MEILTPKSMKALETYVIDEIGICGDILMERAALSLYDECVKRYINPGIKTAVIAGKGNNGADGLAVARLLHCAGYSVDVFTIHPTDNHKGLFKIQYDILMKLNVPILQITRHTDLSGYAVIIDAILGTGFNRNISAELSEIIDKINAAPGVKVCVDIPSGLDGSSCAVYGNHIKAGLTVTFCRKKVCHALDPAREMCGEIVVADIGIPDKYVPEYADVTEITYVPALPRRTVSGNKGDYGYAVIAGGAPGTAGASVMAAISCLHGGAGRVAAVIPEKSAAYFTPYPQIMAHSIHGEKGFNISHVDAVLKICESKDVLAVGPGIGRDEDTRRFLQELIKKTVCPLVIDADALYALDEKTLQSIKHRAILTPHIGEFSAMMGMDKNTIKADPLAISKEYACKYGIFLMLKSSQTIVSTPDGKQYICSWGTPALSKGGSGDILTGVTAALVAQKYSFTDACLAANYIIGTAAGKAASCKQIYSVIPTDIINNLGAL